MAYHVYFEQQLTDLQQEIAEHHPPLAAILVSQKVDDIYVKIQEIAAYCDMVLHGDYTKEDILELCTIMTKKLVEKRTIHLSSNGGFA